jgi:hypothetical protein
LGWCKACGYCKSLEESEQKAAPETSSQPNTLTATGSAIGQSPLWMWVTLAGIAAIVGGTWAAGHYLTLSPFQCALFTTLQTVAGLLIMFVGQFIGLLRIAPDDPTLSFKDALFPFKLYTLAFKCLPSTQWTIYLGVWGLTAIIAANVFVAGLPHWLTYLPGNKNNPAVKTKNAK